MKFIGLAAFGGAIGAAGRYVIGIWAMRLFGAGFPWGTLCVNIIGSFLMGVLIETIALKYAASEEMRVFLATGFLGGFTTFSAFSLEAVLMLQRQQLGLAFSYITASVALSIGGLFVGLIVARAIL